MYYYLSNGFNYKYSIENTKNQLMADFPIKSYAIINQ